MSYFVTHPRDKMKITRGELGVLGLDLLHYTPKIRSILHILLIN